METLLAAMEVGSIESTLKKALGMLVLALWNQEVCTLALVRDRIGEKALYYGWQGGVFLFGSKLKARRAHSTKRKVESFWFLAKG
jgi:asparagine synthase (glutamine-hydrolysing)